MYRIRLHGRGGQGVKTAGRVIGSALFESGFEVQDAPRYGAERRGAPMFAYVRADRRPIFERGIVVDPDLLLVADDSLLSVPAAGVLAGASPLTVLVIAGNTPPATWRERLKLDGPIHLLPLHDPPRDDHIPEVSARLAGAAVRLLGLDRSVLDRAIEIEIAPLGAAALAANLEAARTAFDEMDAAAGSVPEGGRVSAESFTPPDWVTLDGENTNLAAPNILGAATSQLVRTGLWRTHRPVLERDQCKSCVWICGSACPDGVISADGDGFPVIDLDHCKGCLICAVQCPRHAFTIIPEAEARKGETEEVSS